MLLFRAYQDGDLPGLVSVWNHTFAGGPNFAPLTEDEFLDRVALQPSFDASTLRVAVAGTEVRGFVHFGPFTDFWFALPERRVIPNAGQIWALVAPSSEPELTASLLREALTYMERFGVRRVLFYPSWVQCTQPFYNGLAGAYEMPGVSTQRAELLALLEANGFVPVAHYATPELDLSDRRHLSELLAESARLWSRIEGTGVRPRLRDITSAFFRPRRVVELVWGLETVATTAFALWDEYYRAHGRRLYGITGVQVARNWRGQGLGKLVMIMAAEAALREGAEALHLHVYQGNEPAWNLYHKALGFAPRHAWMTLERTS